LCGKGSNAKTRKVISLQIKKATVREENREGGPTGDMFSTVFTGGRNEPIVSVNPSVGNGSDKRPRVGRGAQFGSWWPLK